MNKFSSIQFGIKNNSLTLTAYGEPEIKAVKKWIKLYTAEKHIKLHNKSLCKELYTFGFLESMQTYQIKNMIASPEVREELWKAGSYDKRLERMQQYLQNNFNGFYNHINWHVNKELDKVSIHKYHRIKKDFYGFKNKKLTGYNITFSTNLRLPHILRLGQSTALGFGEVSWL